MRKILCLLAPAIMFASGVAAAAADDLSLVDAAIKSGRLVQAQTMLDLLPADQAGATDVAILRAQLLLAQDQFAAAEEAFGKLAGSAGSDCRVTAGLGIAAGELRHTDRAIPLLQDAAARCKADWRLWSELGRAYSWARRWDDSKAAYDRALALGGPRTALLNDMAVSLLMQRRWPDARALLEQALAAEPGDLRFANNLDIAAASMGQAPVRARGDDDARWAERLANAGYAALLAGRRDDARAWLSQSVAAAPVYSPRTAAMLASLEPGK